MAKLGTITLDVSDQEVVPSKYSISSSAVGLGQSSYIAEKELKGRNVTHQAKYANPGLFIVKNSG